MKTKMSNLATATDASSHRDHDVASGPRLIFAGSGARRGTALLDRAIDLIENHGADPESLLVVTPSDKAAHDLTTRLRNRLNTLGIRFNPSVMYAGTFLSLCLRVLEEHREHTRLQRNYTVMDAFDQHYFLYQRLDDYLALANSDLVLGCDATRWKQAQTLLRRLNAVSELALDRQPPAAASAREERALAACYKKYRQHLEKANALDAATAQLAALHLLENNRAVLAGLKKQVAYLIIDAHQETSAIKERILACFVDLRSLPCLAGSETQRAHSASASQHGVTHNAASQPTGEQNVVEFRQIRRPAGDRVPWWLR